MPKRSAPSKTRSRKASTRKTTALTARGADRHELYQRSVQDSSWEVKFIDRVFRERHQRSPLSLREDFCGTALLCAEWIKSHSQRTALGVDLDPEVLAWGIDHNLSPLGEPGQRLYLLEQDVRESTPTKSDVVVALNFSYWVFKTRQDLLGYFKAVREGLTKDGLVLLDAYGGWEAQEPMLEPRDIGGFTYVWDQDAFDPVTHDVTNHIHFEFADGTRMNKAFTYQWRLWSLPEIQELLTEAGFSKVSVYWDGTDEDSAPRYRPAKRAKSQPGWIAYIIAER
jgi:hypothetical protein